MKDRLIDLIEQSGIICDNCPEYDCSGWAEHCADHLLANGVIVPPVKVGQTVYLFALGIVHPFTVDTIETGRLIGNNILIAYCGEQENLKHWSIRCDFLCFGKDIFLTRKEAERALKERRV